MRIGIDASSLIQNKSGIGSFTGSFLEAFKEEARGHELFFYHPSKQGDLKTLERIWWEALELPRRAEKDKVEILYSPGFSPPPRGRFKKIVTVHDVIGLIYPKNTGIVSRWYWSRWLPKNIRQADLRIASSESTKRDLEKYLRIHPNSVQVVPLAANPIFVKIKETAGVEKCLIRHALKKPFLLAVGTLEPRKNGVRLVRAFQRIAPQVPGLLLVFVGKDAGAENLIRKAVKEAGLEERVKILGYTSDEDLANLYNGALGYVIISLYEGFGLPVLEAMSCGLTGVISDNSSLPEVAGDTAWKVNPEDLDQISGALLELATDDARRASLAAKAYERSKIFSYRKMARQMMEILEKSKSWKLRANR